MAPRFRPVRQAFGERYLPVTVRPTEADVAIARTVARKTGPAPERLARALTWGTDGKGALGTDGCRLARLARCWRTYAARSQPRRDCGCRSVAAAPRHEAAVRPGPSGSQDSHRSSPRGFVFRQARGCVSFRPRAAHGRAGIRGRRFARGTPRVVQALAVGLSLTRVTVLAHWASDVVAGFAIGMALKRFLRFWTDFSVEPAQDAAHVDPDRRIMPWPQPDRNMGARPDDRVRRSISVGRHRGVGVLDAWRYVASEELRRAVWSRAFRCVGDAWHRRIHPRCRIRGPANLGHDRGAVALAAYAGAVCHLLMRARLRVASATLVAVVVWLVVAFGLLAVAGGLT